MYLTNGGQSLSSSYNTTAESYAWYNTFIFADYSNFSQLHGTCLYPPSIHVHFEISYLGCPCPIRWGWQHYMLYVSVLRVNARQATFSDIIRHIPVFLGLPPLLGPGIGKSVTDLIQGVARCTSWTCPDHLSESPTAKDCRNTNILNVKFLE